MKIDIKKFRSIADNRQITDTQVMEQAGLSESTFNWIMENRFIELDTLERIACAIGCTIQDIALLDVSVGDTKGGGQGENVIEWLKDSKMATVTFTQRRYITRVRQYAESRPGECSILAENTDGSICARVPVSWVKISPPRISTERQRVKARELMSLYNLKHGIIARN